MALTVTLLTTRQAEKNGDTAAVCETLRKLDITVLTAGREPSAAAAERIAQSDAVLALGGDGMLLHAAKAAAVQNKPVLGINCGHLGFMAGLEVNEAHLLRALVERTYRVEERLLLDVQLCHDGTPAHRFLAMNEVAINRGANPHMLTLMLSSGDRPVTRYRADGVLVATPSGSTAYSLAAGGPVVSPDVDCLLVTPLCPQAPYARPFVFRGDSRLTVRVGVRHSPPASLAIDGEESRSIGNGDEIVVRQAEQKVRLIQIKPASFFDVLNDKLMKGEPV